jgi:hypothetical protein
MEQEHKKAQTFVISQRAIDSLNAHKKLTGRAKSLLVERAILRYCGNGKEKP